CAHPEQDGQEQECHDGGLPSLVCHAAGHSTLSVVVLVISPDLTTRPSRLMSYGYEALTVTSVPGAQGFEVTSTCRYSLSSPLADCSTASWVTQTGHGWWRDTAALRAPARTASVSVT